MAVSGAVCRSRVLVLEGCRLLSIAPFLQHQDEVRIWRRGRHCRHMSSSGDSHISSDDKQEVVVEYRKGLPTVRVPLPTSRQPCLFIVRPVANTVQDLADMIRSQDPAVTDISFRAKDDCLIACSNRIENLLEEDFRLSLNGKTYNVKVPQRQDVTKPLNFGTPTDIIHAEDLERIDEIKNLVNSLYIALHVEDHVATREREILEQLEQINVQLDPLEKKKAELDNVATRRTTAMTWAGLGLMSVQFGILARLTWWEYSWDIMEPVTYFVTYGTAMAAYAYFVLTKQEYLLPDVRDRQYLITVHKRAAKIGLDLNEYNKLKARANDLETSLTKLREPRLPPPILPSPASIPPTSLLAWVRSLARK